MGTILNTNEVGTPVPPGIPSRVAAHWIARYEAMMAGELPHRREQLEVVAALARQRLRRLTRPRLLELGCGPASLSRRLAAEVASLEVVAVDADPFLVALAAAVPHPRVRVMEVTVGAPDWIARLPCDGGADLVVAVAVVHYLDPEAAGRWYADISRVLRPGGALVLADAFGPVATGVVGRSVGTGVADPTWASWWAAVDADPQLRPWRGRVRGPACDGDVLLDAAAHRRALREVGFDPALTLWRRGGRAVLVAERR